MELPTKELLKVFTQSEEYIFELPQSSGKPLCYSLKEGESSIFRSEHSISLLIESRGGNGHPINITIPMSDHSATLYKERTKELTCRRLPQLTQYQIVRLRCKRRTGRTLPIITEAVVQHLPQGELLSTAICGASPLQVEAVYAAVSGLERSLYLSHIAFRSLGSEDLILGDDGRLYPFRYEGLTFDVKRGSESTLRECDELRSEIERLSGHAPAKAHYAAEDEPYSESLCDIYGGYITCRTEREGCIAVEALTGWGFIDTMGRLVIEAKYLSVDDFTNGSAIVQHPQSENFGLIDPQGDYILRPIYPTRESLRKIYELKKH